MQDITDRLGAELRTPPPPTFDVAATVGAGRRAVRRRRLATGGAALALALALVVGGAGIAATSQFGGSAGTPPVAVADGVSDEGLASTSRLAEEIPAGYAPGNDGVVLVQKGWEVRERIDGPVDGRMSDQRHPVADSVALALRKGEQVVWVLLYRFPASQGEPSSETGGASGETPAESGYTDLASWVAHQRDTLFSEPVA